MGLTLTLMALVFLWFRNIAIKQWEKGKIKEFETAYRKEQEETEIRYPAKLKTLTDEQFWAKLEEREKILKEQHGNSDDSQIEVHMLQGSPN